jgi:type III secretion protein C
MKIKTGRAAHVRALALLASLVAPWPLAQAAAPKNDTAQDPEASLRRPYTYFANGESVSTVLRNLSRNFGLTLKQSANLKEPISGRIGGESAADMLTRLSEMYGFNWFIFGRTLYVSGSKDRVVQRIRVSPGSLDSLKQALTDIGLLTPRFGWGAVPEEDAVIVSGPKQYVNLIVATLAKLDSGDTLQTMVFRLKYASVEDRRIQLREREIVTRGIASILSGLMSKTSSRTPGGPASGGGTTLPGPALPALPGKLNEPAAADASRIQPADQARANAHGPAIESDPRLNAIIIRDHISKQKMYADLIAELDVPTSLVEIEASIIEIDQSKLDELGTDWKFGSGRLGVISRSGDKADGAKAGVSLGLGQGAASVIEDLRGFNATLRLLESSGEAKILAKPVVLTLDNLGAVLDLTDTSYTSVVGEKVANVVPVTVGTLLRVTPHVIQEDTRTRIQLAVDIEDGTQQETTETSRNLRVKKTNISTQAIIEPSQSLLIAGYSLEQDANSNAGIPVLGRLPLVGPLFSSRSNSSKRLKRLFLITPKLLPDDSVAASRAVPQPPAMAGARMPKGAPTDALPPPQSRPAVASRPTPINAALAVPVPLEKLLPPPAPEAASAGATPPTASNKDSGAAAEKERPAVVKNVLPFGLKFSARLSPEPMPPAR